MKNFVMAMVLGSLFSSPVSAYYAKEKEPVFAGCLSAIVPGLGQVYNGQVWRGALMFISVLSFSIVASLPEEKLEMSFYYDPYGNPVIYYYTVTTYPNAWMWILVLAFDIYSIADAVIVADKINKGKMGLEFNLKGDGAQLSLNYKF